MCTFYTTSPIWCVLWKQTHWIHWCLMCFFSHSSISRYFWSHRGIKGLALTWEGHWCRWSHRESTADSAALCSFSVVLESFVPLLLVTMSCIWFEGLSLIKHISYYLCLCTFSFCSIHLDIILSLWASLYFCLFWYIFFRAALPPHRRRPFLMLQRIHHIPFFFWAYTALRASQIKKG